MSKYLFIDRDGTLIEEPADEQIDSFEKLRFMPGVFASLAAVCRRTDYRLVLVSNQDGLGTPAFPEETFWPVHRFVLEALRREGIVFDEGYIDCSFPADNAPTRKPGTAMLQSYIDNPVCDMPHCYVIGDRQTDALLAERLGCRSLILSDELTWPRIAEILIAGERTAEVHRTTRETDIFVRIALDRPGTCSVSTGLGFFDHMLEQIAHHGGLSLEVTAHGDLHVDEHHTIEDTALALGECLRRAVGDKLGMERYGYVLPMDDCLCQCALDLGGRPWLVWDAAFQRERIGDVPTEMLYHFFHSLAVAAQMNLHLHATGTNEHHKAEGLFKAFARALRKAVRRDAEHLVLPSSKGTL